MKDCDEFLIRMPIAEVFPPMGDEDSDTRMVQVPQNGIQNSCRLACIGEQTAWMREQKRVTNAPVRSGQYLSCRIFGPPRSRQTSELEPAGRNNLKPFRHLEHT